MLVDLLSVGAENAKTAKELCKLLGWKTTRAVTLEVHRLREVENVLICSSCKSGQEGYYLHADRNDVADFSRQMHSRIRHIQKAVAGADAYLQDVGA